MPSEVQTAYNGQDQVSLVDIMQRVKILARVFDKEHRVMNKTDKDGEKVKPPQSFNQATM